MYNFEYYQEKKQDVDEDVRRCSQRLINDFLQLFNEVHIELNRLGDKKRKINEEEEESKKREELEKQKEIENQPKPKEEKREKGK